MILSFIFLFSNFIFLIFLCPIFLSGRIVIPCVRIVISCGTQIRHNHGIVCQNKAISDTRVALGMARNATEAVFRVVP
jgi:hypothetical protein